MRKMAVHSSDFQLSKFSKSEESVVEDRFSQLPHSILVYIVSFLTLEESARTSILSKYWRGLWLFTARLDFDASELLRKLAAKKFYRGWWGLEYVEWVKKVLQAHKSVNSDKNLVLDEFRIRFQLDQSFEKDVDKWLSYAFAMKVRRFELDLMKLKTSPCMISEAYCMPRLLDQSTNEHSEEFSINHFKKSIRTLVLTEFKLLRSLSLAGVNVTGEVLDFFLRKFPALECLKVCNSQDLVSLKVCGASLALKHLEITHCLNLECIIVRDTCLVSLKITLLPDLVLENVPMLVDVWISALRVREILPQLSICLSRVKVLTLCLKSYDVEEDGAKAAQVPELPEIKQLILIVEKIKDDSLIPLISMIRAMPNLEKFVLKLKHTQGMIAIDEESEKPSSLPLQHLKIVELRGYHGLAGEDELIMHLQENAIALKRIVVEPCDLFIARYTNNKRKPVVVENIRYKAKARAEKLKGVISSSVEMVVL